MNTLMEKAMGLNLTFAAKNIDLVFETGQETADALRDFLEDLGCPNVGVNFDPANMILYGKGDPDRSDARARPVDQASPHQGREPPATRHLGRGSVAGTGQVDWKAFFATLESSASPASSASSAKQANQRVEDILTASKWSNRSSELIPQQSIIKIMAKTTASPSTRSTSRSSASASWA
jgi:L-ribulose-5-phosphate 3-epimerase